MNNDQKNGIFGLVHFEDSVRNRKCSIVFRTRLLTLKIIAMSKGLDAKKEAKKEPAKSLKEKRLEKKAKKEKGKSSL